MMGNYGNRRMYQEQDGYLYGMNTKRVSARSIDHIVYTVFDLEAAMDDFESRLGVRPIFGGYHPTFGTKNALVNLHHGMYLELLAADNANNTAQRPRWMGVDALLEQQLTRWAITSNNLEGDAEVLQSYHPDMGQILDGSRNTTSGALLQWQLSKPLPFPEVELIPFCIDWSGSEIHPNKALPDMGCTLIELYGTHPKPDIHKPILDWLGIDLRIEKSAQISLKMVLQCPKGIVTL